MTSTWDLNVETWDEQPVHEGDAGRKITHAVVTQRLSGDGASGTGLAHWLMSYRPDGTADFVGIQLLDGTLDGRAGTVQMRSIGSFDGSVATATLEVIDGSGTGDLRGITGSGTFDAPHGGTPRVTLDHSLG